MTVLPAVRGVYLITPDEPDTARLLARTQPLLQAGTVAWLQYRNKSADSGLRRHQALTLQALATTHGVPLIVNDAAALALEVGAAGMHREDAPADLAELRAILGPQALLGASCYGQATLADEAVRAGASYVSFGAFFASRTKPGPHRAAPQVLRDTAHLGVPRVAIGGLTPDNAGPLVAAGADLLAVVSGIYDAPDPLAAARAFQALFVPDASTSRPRGNDDRAE